MAQAKSIQEVRDAQKSKYDVGRAQEEQKRRNEEFEKQAIEYIGEDRN